MAAPARLLYVLTWLALAIVTPVRGSPVMPLRVLSARGLQVNNYGNGTIVVYDPSSGQVYTQGSPSDGSGIDFSAPAVIWIAYCFLMGIPLIFTGIRFPRITKGTGIGIIATACLWAALINTESAKNLSDLVLTLVPILLFIPGFVFGLFDYGRLAGVLLITIASGFSWGVRISLFRSDLLVREVYGDWLIGTAFAFLNICMVPYHERIAVAIASASVGTFFIGLAIDLIVNKQAGMSSGLRLLCDRNRVHYLNLVYKGWKPPTSTIIIMAVCLGVTPLIAYAQHRIYPQSYTIPPRDIDYQYKTRPLPRPERTDEEKNPVTIAVQEAVRSPSPSKESFYTESPSVTRPQSQVMDSY